MDRSRAIAMISALSRGERGVFPGREARAHGITRHQLGALCELGIIERDLPDIYRMTAVARSDEQRLRAALLSAGADAAAAGRSAGWWYGLQGVRAIAPEVVVVGSAHPRSKRVNVHRSSDAAALMVRRHCGLRVTGVEATLVRLAHLLDGEALEVACEDARRRGLTSIPALHAYLDRHARSGQRGVAPLRRLMGELDPKHPSRSTLEVKARRLLVANGLGEFVREYPLSWNGRTYQFDFAFVAARTILETNGRRWHDDPIDYEHNNEKWSVPGRRGFRLVMATWAKVTTQPTAFIDEVRTSLAA
jgi:hypothetical protein